MMSLSKYQHEIIKQLREKKIDDGEIILEAVNQNYINPEAIQTFVEILKCNFPDSKFKVMAYYV